jgi:hypothetical protein
MPKRIKVPFNVQNEDYEYDVCQHCHLEQSDCQCPHAMCEHCGLFFSLSAEESEALSATCPMCFRDTGWEPE